MNCSLDNNYKEMDGSNELKLLKAPMVINELLGEVLLRRLTPR